MFHPYGRAFWMPLVTGLQAAGCCWVVGWVLTGWSPAGGAMLASLGFILFYVYSFFFWHQILKQSFDPVPLSQPVPEVEEENINQEMIYCTSSTDGSVIRLIRHLPVSTDQLMQFCLGMIKEPPELTTYSVWLDRFSQDEFSLFRTWLFDNHYAYPGRGGQMSISAEGKDFFAMVAFKGITVYSPA